MSSVVVHQPEVAAPSTSDAAMTPQALLALIANGEDSRHQFKRDVMHTDALAAELVALANTAGGLLHADEVPVARTTINDIALSPFNAYFERRYGRPASATGQDLPQLLHNLNLAQHGTPNLAGMLLFGRTPAVHLPAFIVKAVAFPGMALHDDHYNDSEDIDGSLPEQYQRSMAFIKRNLHHVQGEQGFNSPGQLEVPPAVFEELLVNALVHRDYFIQAPVRLLIFADRVEITSPGHLPNHLDTQQIRFGLSNLRNPALASHAFHLLPYRGLGSGIPRATAAWPGIEFIDDRRGNQFKVVIQRPAMRLGE